MYPFLRFAHTLLTTKAEPDLPISVTHRSQHMCWPWDLDVFREMNNGRVLTLYDLGRFGLGKRTRLLALLRQENWGLAVAGSSIRYRRRLRAFDRFEMRSRVIGWDPRFIYMEQSMWRKETCTSHVLIRVAVTDANGIVPTEKVAAAWGLAEKSPELPPWVLAWIAADAERPWPPMDNAPPQKAPSAA